MSEVAPAASPSAAVRIWDLPVRMFHWSLVALLGAAWWTAEEGLLDWHRLSGYAILVLLLFRISWGFAGSGTARFSSFVRSPGATLAFARTDMLRRDASPSVGHNPLGGWSVVLMLTLLVTQVILGMFAVDIDGMESGPFSYLVEFDTGRLAAEWHELNFTFLQALVVLHVVAIAFHQIFHRDALIRAMVTGDKLLDHQSVPSLRFASFGRAVLILLVAVGAVWLLVDSWGQQRA